MPPIIKIISTVKSDFPHISFKSDATFYWSSSINTIAHKPIKKKQDLWLLLHEVAHAELGHNTYTSDVELVRLESKAWQYARKSLAPKYSLAIDTDFIEDSLDTYRLWLHKRSLCPSCQQTGIQQKENTYSCLNCRCSWRVNEARLCGFKRKNLSSSLAAAAN